MVPAPVVAGRQAGGGKEGEPGSRVVGARARGMVWRGVAWRGRAVNWGGFFSRWTGAGFVCRLGGRADRQTTVMDSREASWRRERDVCVCVCVCVCHGVWDGLDWMDWMEGELIDWGQDGEEGQHG